MLDLAEKHLQTANALAYSPEDEMRRKKFYNIDFSYEQYNLMDIQIQVSVS